MRGTTVRGEADIVDFFVSRRGSTSDIAQEVAQVLLDAGYTAFVQDFDIPLGANFAHSMHDVLKRCRHLVVVYSRDYEDSRHTLSELFSFYAEAARSESQRRIILLRADDAEPSGLLSGIVSASLVGIDAPEHRREVILAAAEGRTLASPSRPRTFRGVPPINPHFMGREHHLKELRSKLHEAGNSGAFTPVAIHGLGGIGKTTLVVEYAHRYAGDYAGVWWAPAENRTILLGSLAELASLLDARLGSGTFLPRIAEPTDLEKVAKAGLAKLAASPRPWLLVYDNAENPEAVRDLIPGAGACLIVTSRWADWAGWANELNVDELPPDEAVRFLIVRSGVTDLDGASALANALGRLPLALDHAGAYVRLTGNSFGRYVDRLGALIGKAPRGATYPASVGATFGLAMSRAAEECPAADKLLSFVSILAPERIPLELIDHSILNEADRDDATMALTAVSLIRHDPYPDGTPAITVHRVVQTVARSRFSDDEQTKPIIETAIRRLSEALPDNGYSEPRTWPHSEKLMPHVLELRTRALDAKIESHALAVMLDGAANALHGRGAFAAAEPLLREAVDIGKRVLGPDHADVGLWINNLANIFMNTARYQQAEPLYREAIEIGVNTLGREHYRVATRINNLATLLMETGRYHEAEGLYHEAIRTVEKTFGRKHQIIAARLVNLGNLMARTERLPEAEAAYVEALAVGEVTIGRDSPHTSNCMAQLANVLRDTGRHAEAEPLYREAIGNMSKSLGIAHPGVGGARRNLAMLLLVTGRPEEALLEAQEALSIQERAFGLNHGWTSEAAEVVAKSLTALGRADEADQVQRRHGLTDRPN